MNATYTNSVFSSSSDYTGLAVPPHFLIGDNMPMGYSDNIILLRKRAGLTQEQLAEMVGVAQPTVQRWEQGKREPDFEALSTLAQALGVEPGDFFSHDIVAALGPRLFVKGEVAAGVWREAFEFPDDEWATFTGRPNVTANIEHRFGLRVVGDSMNLKYPHGTIVECVSLFGRVEAKPGRRVVVVRLRDDMMCEATVKKLVDQDGELWLVPESTNPAFQPIRLGAKEPGIIETRIAAVVVAAIIGEE